jgi:hypothetical protein
LRASAVIVLFGGFARQPSNEIQALGQSGWQRESPVE